MEKNEIFKLYRSKIRPKVFIKTLNAFIAFFFVILIFGTGVSRCASGSFKESISLPIAPVPSNEATYGKTDPKEEEKLLNQYFDYYAREIKVNSNELFYRLKFNIRSFPLTNLIEGELAFEVYSKDKDYLFTFYADDYWHQEGYDEGEYWHQQSLSDAMTVRFPYPGKFYIMASVPTGPKAKQLFDIFKKYTDGNARMDIYKNDKPYSGFSMVLGTLIFSVLGFILLKRRKGSMFKPLIFNGLDFEQNQYLVKIDSAGEKLPDQLFYVTGYSRTKGQGDSIELILKKDNDTAYLELEREYDDETYEYYTYFYDRFPEEEFETIPKWGIEFQGRTFKLQNTRNNIEIKTVYENGLSETHIKNVVDMGTPDETEYLSFEFEKNPADFDVTYGKLVDGYQIWRIPK
jgi:hypothetical protein